MDKDVIKELLQNGSDLIDKAQGDIDENRFITIRGRLDDIGSVIHKIGLEVNK